MTTTPWHIRAARKYGQSAVLYSALALSAPGEYSLAMMAGWSYKVAWLMPAVMSLYAAIGASVAKSATEAARMLRGTADEADARRRARNATTGALLALLAATAAQITDHILTADVVGPRLWVLVAVSAVPPLVAAHVLHIDPPAEVVTPREALPEGPQEPAGGSAGDEVEELPTEPAKGAQGPTGRVLKTYDEAAEALGVKSSTIRGWVFAGHVAKHEGPTPKSVRVDLVECTLYRDSRAVGA